MDLGQLAQLTRDTGIAPGYLRGIESGTNLAQTVANTDKARAELSRYQAETPTYLQQKQQELEKARLGNLPGQAQEQADVYNLQAKSSAEEAKLTAQKAEEARRQLGPAKTLQMLTEIEAEQGKVLDVAARLLQTYPTADQALSVFVQQFPQYTKDPQFNAIAQRLRGLPADKAFSELTMWRNKIASGLATAKAEQQAELQKLDLQGQNQKEVAQIQSQAGIEAAGVRAGAGGAKTSMADIYTKYLQQYTTSPQGSPEREEARLILNMLKGGSTTIEESGLGLPPDRKIKESLPADKPKDNPAAPAAPAAAKKWNPQTKRWE